MGENDPIQVSEVPEHWNDLTPEQRAELIAMAKGRLWWREFGAKFAWFGKVSGILITILALYTLLKDTTGSWIASWMHNGLR